MIPMFLGPPFVHQQLGRTLQNFLQSRHRLLVLSMFRLRHQWNQSFLHFPQSNRLAVPAQPRKPSSFMRKRSSDLREHLLAFTLSGCSSSSTSSIIYRFLLSAYSLSILSSVFLSVSLVRVSFHTFLSSAHRPSSFVLRPSSVVHYLSVHLSTFSSLGFNPASSSRYPW